MNSHHARPLAVGLVRADVSGSSALEHAAGLRRHAEGLGYQYIHTVRPPHDDRDPVGYALGIAAGLEVAALIVWDLETVGHTPSRVCEQMDLETVVPPETWAASAYVHRDPGHGYPAQPLTELVARHIMQDHLTCRATRCPRKAFAYAFLVKEGKIVPPTSSPRERAAARGLEYPALDELGPALPDGVDLAVLVGVLGKLTDPDPDPDLEAARLDRSVAGQR
ncbi:hypothetical protein [Nocardia sp. alder85J]|uniref:hypothetical protein n=1 Tax=Nocardia sp. alder85J TaxID=2862949 RepID=UPI001CD38BDA|nr:hypothetical protein [Nocardia sp. alder85J]MCX4094481.1 hypothetical protein [Nocardia sp. alder85J]